MRDNHDGMMEFINAFEKDGHYFAIVELESKKFQFGVSRAGYRVLKRVLQARPFDQMPGLKYRYFYSGSQKIALTEHYSMQVRIELYQDATQGQFDIPKDLHANLLWFRRLENIEDATYLEIKS